jgi:hypothetical protein
MRQTTPSPPAKPGFGEARRSHAVERRSTIVTPSTQALRLAVTLLFAAMPHDARAQAPAASGASPEVRGGATIAAIASWLAVDRTNLDPDIGGDGPNRLGAGVQAAAHFWFRGVTVGVEGSYAAASWTDSRPRSLGPETTFDFGETFALLMGGVGWPRRAPAVVLKGGVGFRSGSLQRGEPPDPGAEGDRNRFVAAIGADVAVVNARMVRPVITVRYIRAARSPAEQSAGLGSGTLRLGFGIDLGQR